MIITIKKSKKSGNLKLLKMASIQEKSRDETGKPSTSNGTREELQIPQRPCPKSQRKIIPTEKARKMHSDIKIPKEPEIPKGSIHI